MVGRVSAASQSFEYVVDCVPSEGTAAFQKNRRGRTGHDLLNTFFGQSLIDRNSLGFRCCGGKLRRPLCMAGDTASANKELRTAGFKQRYTSLKSSARTDFRGRK